MQVESRATDSHGVLLRDEWARPAVIPLGGWIERQRFPPVLMAALALVLTFLLFQVVIGPGAMLVLLAASGESVAGLIELLSRPDRLVEQYPGTLLVGNAIGQVFGLALPVLLLTRMHTRRVSSFLRLRAPEAGMLLLGVAGLFAALPLVQWLGNVNQAIPLPEGLRQFEQAQAELIEKILFSDLGFFFNLLVVAVVPALCEEVVFRGYLQRQVERGTSVLAAIMVVGVLFGLYHMRLSQALPLSALGVYLCWLTWRTGSLWPAVLVHFLNNGIAVGVGAYLAAHPEIDVESVENLPVPWYLVVAGALGLAAVVRAMDHRADGLRPAAAGTDG